MNWLLFENCELSVSRPSINLQSHGKAICVPAALQAVKQAVKQAAKQAVKQAVKPSGHNLHPQSIVLKDQEARHGTRPSLLIFHGLRDESVQPQKRTHHTCIPRRNTSTMCNSMGILHSPSAGLPANCQPTNSPAGSGFCPKWPIFLFFSAVRA